MNKSMLIALLVVLCGFCPQAINRPDLQVVKAAEGQMDVFLDKIEPGQEAIYGFTNEDDKDLCDIGKPYRVLELKKEFFDSKQLAENTDYISIKNEWRAPVMIKGQYRALLTVSGYPGNYSVSSLGDPGLARELQQKATGVNESDEYYILRIYPLLAEFFVHEGDNSFINAQFIPLESAVKAIPALSVSKKTAYTLTEVEQMVKEALTKNTKETTPAPKKTAPKKTTPKKNVVVQ